MALSPTQRSLKHLRDLGWTVAVVEHWNAHARIRQDLFGFIDLLALKDGETLAVQTTSSGNLAARVHKIEASEHLATVLAAGWKVIGHGWSKSAKSKRWELRQVVIA